MALAPVGVCPRGAAQRCASGLQCRLCAPEGGRARTWCASGVQYRQCATVGGRGGGARTWKQVSMSQDPSFLAVPVIGLAPAGNAEGLDQGQEDAPARADTEGIAGASRASATTRLYPSPREVLRKRATNWTQRDTKGTPEAAQGSGKGYKVSSASAAVRLYPRHRTRGKQ